MNEIKINWPNPPLCPFPIFYTHTPSPLSQILLHFLCPLRSRAELVHLTKSHCVLGVVCMFAYSGLLKLQYEPTEGLPHLTGTAASQTSWRSHSVVDPNGKYGAIKGTQAFFPASKCSPSVFCLTVSSLLQPPPFCSVPLGKTDSRIE